MAVPPQGAVPPGFQDSVDALRGDVSILSAAIQGFAAGMQELVKTSGDVEKNTGDMEGNLRGAVNYIDDIATTMKEVASLAKGLNSSLGSKTYGQAVEHFKKMKTVSEDIVKNGKTNAAQMVFLRRTIHECEQSITKLSDKTGDMNKPLKGNLQLLGEIKKSADAINGSFDQFARSVGNVKLGGIHKAILSLNGALGKSNGRMNKVVATAQAAHDVKRAREEKTQNNKATFAAKVDAVTRKVAKQYPELIGTDGQIDPVKLSAHKAARNMATDEFVGPEGSRIDKFLVNRMLGGTGRLASKGWDMVGAGGGSAVEGAIGAAEGGVGGMEAKMLGGSVGIAAAAAIALKDTFDAVANQNKEYEKNLGKGGIFTGDQTGLEALGNVKNNLRAWGLNRYGISTERQMSVAQTMNESGLSIASLATQTKGNQLPSDVGDIATIAFKQAREIGLTDVEGTKQTIKMMQQYKMTLSGTQQFFQTIGKDIRAAGFSTTKYLELIDDVSSHFDNMGKSIDTVTTVLRLMGSTGTDTAEQMKDNLESLTGKGEKTDEQRSALLMGMSGSSRSGFGDAMDKLAQQSSDNFAKTLDEAITEVMPSKRKEILDGLDLNEPKDMEAAVNRFRGNVTGERGTQKTEQLGGALKQAQIARMNADALKSSDPIGASFLQGATTSNPIQKIVQNIEALSQGLSKGGTSLGAFLKDPSSLNVDNAAVVSQVSKVYGYDGKPMDTRAGINEITSSYVDEIRKGLSPEATAGMKSEDIDKFYSDFLKQAGYTPIKGFALKQIQGIDPDKLVKGISSSMDSGKLADMLDKNNLVNKSLASRHLETTTAQAEKIAGIAEATRSTEDILKDIRGAITSELGRPIMGILDIINKKWGGGGADEAAAIRAKNDPLTQMDEQLVDKIIEKNKDWKDPQTGLTATQLKTRWDNVNDRILSGTGDKTDDTIRKYLEGALHSMAGGVKSDSKQISLFQSQSGGYKYDSGTGGFLPTTHNPVAEANAKAVSAPSPPAADLKRLINVVNHNTQNVGYVSMSAPNATDSTQTTGGENAFKPSPNLSPTATLTDTGATGRGR